MNTYIPNEPSIEKNVNAIVDEIAKTKRVLDKKSLQFHSFRRFLLTIGFPTSWTIQRLGNSYFHTDNVDFYRMIIGEEPVSLKALKIRAKSFLKSVEDYDNRLGMLDSTKDENTSN